jgi:ATP-binding cassette subfamily B protein/subfamily B ATP-binding cassette protein MsbA
MDTRSPFRRLWADYLSPHKGTMGLAFLVMAVDGATLGALSWLIQPLFDDVFAAGSEAALWPVGLAILCLFLTRAIATILARVLMSRISTRVASAMQGDMLAHLMRLDGRFFQDNPPGALIERVQGDTLAVQNIWGTLITGVGRDGIALIGLFTVAISIDLRWTLAALVGVPLLLLPAFALQRYIRRKTDTMRHQAGQRATRLDEILHGITQVKLTRTEDYQLGRFRSIVTRYRRAEVRMTMGRAAMPALIDVVTGIGFFAVLLLGGREVAEGQRTVGEFMSFFTAMALTFQPIRRLGDMAGLWQVAKASLARINGLLDTQPQTDRPAEVTGLRLSAPAVTFDAVHFAHGEVPVLRGLSFTAPGGQVTAIVGTSGAGKSTIFNLLTGLLEPDAGRILLGDIDAGALSLPDLRAQFAVVAQESALFDETLRENVVLGRDLAPGVLEAALSAAQADFVAGLPQGIDTPAGPRGSALSGGQRQRIAIARALASGAPVLLLDEATSALDATSEAAVTAALAARGGRTTLVIAHRLATVRDADLILVLDRGRVAESGRHADLLAQGGIYAGMCALQLADG